MDWALSLFLCGTIMISAGCLVPSRWLPSLPNDKLMHFLAYGGMAWLAGHIASSNTELAIWLVALFLAGWVIECLQHLVPGRTFCWRDLAANTAGIVLAAWLL